MVGNGDPDRIRVTLFKINLSKSLVLSKSSTNETHPLTVSDMTKTYPKSISKLFWMKTTILVSKKVIITTKSTKMFIVGFPR